MVIDEADGGKRTIRGLQNGSEGRVADGEAIGSRSEKKLEERSTPLVGLAFDPGMGTTGGLWLIGLG